MKIEYEWIPGCLVPESMLQECSELFSSQYGVWSANDPQGRGGQRVRFGPSRIRRLLESPDSLLTYARYEDKLIGYAIALRTHVDRYGVVSWVTQLVVHADYRRSGIAKTLLYSIWQFSDDFAWGLTSANPFAIRALEKATRRRCSPNRIKRNAKKLISVGSSHVPYVAADAARRITRFESRIDTSFFVDRSTLALKLESATKNTAWLLGELEEGWEWFAFTFKDQEQLSLSADEIRTMLDASDDIARQAYSRMKGDDNHLWARHAAAEASFVVEHCKLQRGRSILDLGCGRGRHGFALAALELDVTGVDYVESFIAQARGKAASSGTTNIEFHHADCREIRLGKTYNAAICLYDVIGTYAENSENARLLETIFVHLVPGGFALLSVMNLGLTKRRAQNYFSLTSDSDKLLTLPASRVMETTGDIFDPKHYLIDRDTDVVYRKEQFVEGQGLPLELIVRDRRFEKEDIETLCKAAGFEVIWSRFVRAGHWKHPVGRTDDHAKEILVLCRRPD